ncbi:MAG: DUF4342 domain-containing protein [Candidatus Promineifilaceae bacterium]|nr:DUF4342 domain-containing protein [Candidatus Promineifilaceae bacterium]
MSEENINVEEEFEAEQGEKEKKTWEEHLHVDSDEIVGKVQELLREAAVRKITIKDESGKTLLSIPLYAGFASLVVFGAWNALALLAAWVAKFSIIIEREGEEPQESEKEAAAGEAAGAAA